MLYKKFLADDKQSTSYLIHRQSYDDNTLTHYGVKGMKWGVRKETDSSSGGSRFKKSNSSSNVVRKKVNDEVVLMLTYLTSAAITVFASIRYNDYKQKNVRAIRETEITDPAVKKAISAHNDRILNKLESEAPIKSMKGFKKIPKDKLSEEPKPEHVNDPKDAYNRQQNCVLCSMALCMRKKGYDVKANGTDDAVYTDGMINKLSNSKNSMKYIDSKVRNKADLEKALFNQPEGSYGVLLNGWVSGGGHAIYYQKNNGKIELYDAQAGVKLASEKIEGVPKYLEEKTYFKISNTREFGFVRMDNYEPSDSFAIMFDNAD